MSKTRTLVVLLALLLSVFTLDIFFLRPSGVYSYTSGEAYGFKIGMNKDQIFDRLHSRKKAILSLKTREPFHDQNLTRDKELQLTGELKLSNYWVLYESATYTYLLIFRDDKVYRILGHFRKFGELETGLSMFTASYPINTSKGIIEDKDTFAGLSPKQIDSLILLQEEWTQVFIN